MHLDIYYSILYLVSLMPTNYGKDPSLITMLTPNIINKVDVHCPK